VFKLSPASFLPDLPSACAICHAWPTRLVCKACAAEFAAPAPRCRTCALRLPAGQAQCGACLIEPPPLSTCHALVDYAYPWAGMIAKFKFQDTPSWAKPIVTLMKSHPPLLQALHQADLLLPVPLSATRLRERGYNQAWELLKHLSLDRSKNHPTLLLRTAHTQPQLGLTRAQRLSNLKTAFAIDPLQSHRLIGHHIALVDDVMTTGATLHAAANTLLAAGASQVTGLVFARTPAAVLT
jgi:ComF family protein